MFAISIDPHKVKDIPVCRILKKLITLKEVCNNWTHPRFTDAERDAFTQAVATSISIDVEEAKDYEDWLQEYIESRIPPRDCQSTLAPNELLSLYAHIAKTKYSPLAVIAINEYTAKLYDPPEKIA